MALLVVVSPLEDRSAPVTQETLGHALDAGFRSLGAGVKVDNLSNATAQQSLLLNGESDESSENIALDVVCRKTAVVQRFEEELDVLKEVGIGIEDGVLDVVPVQETGH